MVNLGNPLKIKVMRTPEESLAGEIVRLMEKAEQGNAAYVRLADKVAGYYTPVVHLLALAAFAFWWGLMGMAWQPALMIAVTVLIITCPCALGLAVPVAQVLASQWLFRRGILVKSADALERIAKTDTVIFDKTGTLTTGEMEAKADAGSEDLQLAASLAAQSGHPLSWALVKSWDGDLLQLENVTETPGGGVMALWHGEKALLGSRAFCGVEERPEDGAQETWLKRGNRPPVRFVFHDRLRDDAARAVASLKESGLRVTMLSGDRARAAAKVAQELGMDEYHAEVDPRRKLEIIEDMKASGRHVLMTGDGINDAPALLGADASLSPSSAMQVTQNAANAVFQGGSLMAVPDTIKAAVFCQKVVRQNFAMAIAYNLVAVPLAFMGLVTPLVAAVAMSCSSLLVTLNALRFSRLKGGGD